MLELLEVIWGLLEVVAGVVEVFLGWRFYICLAAGMLLIALIYASLESDNVSLALAIPVGVLALGTGLVWDRRLG